MFVGVQVKTQYHDYRRVKKIENLSTVTVACNWCAYRRN